MGKIMLNGTQYGVGGIEQAKDISYDNTESGATATDVQGALDELNAGLTWKLLQAVTGTTSVTLPDKYTELYLNIYIINTADNRAYHRNMIIPYVSIDNIPSAGGYYYTGDKTSSVAVFSNKITIKLHSFQDGNTNFTNSARVGVYYR